MKKGSRFVWEKLLSKYFRVVKGLDAEIEGLRQELCAKASFSPRELFNSLDSNCKSFLSLNDFKVFLKEKYIEFTEESLRRFIHNFDKGNYFSIDYNEFLSVILPKADDALKEEAMKKRAKGSKDKDYSIELVFIKIIQLELNLIHQLALIAEELKHSKDFTTYEAFVVIVNDDDKYITESNLGRFFKENNVEVNDNEMKTLLERIGADEGRVSYEQFLQIFFPFQPVESSSFRLNENLASDKPKEWKRDEEKELFTKKINKESNVKFKHGFSRYDNKTDNIMLNSTKESSFKDYQENEIEHKSVRVNHYRRRSSMNEEEALRKNKKTAEFAPLVYRNARFEANGSLNDNCSSPPRKRERLNQTYQSLFNYSSPLSIQRHPSNNKQEPSTLTFDRNKARYHIRTTPKVIPQTNKNGLNDSIYANDFSSSNPSCKCCDCRPCCKKEKAKRGHLFNLLSDCVINDTKVEELKEEMESDKAVNMISLFEYFTDMRRDYVDKKDLQKKLKDIGLIVSLSDINILFNLYDRDNDSLLNYEEFSDLILPKNYEAAKALIDRKQSALSFTFNDIKPSTLMLLSNIFLEIINVEKVNEKNQSKLLGICTVEEAFNLIKARYSSALSQDDISGFLESNGLSIKQYQLDLLLDRLDKDLDGLVSLNDLTQALTPKER